jgi:hypothetical protein
MSAQTLDADLVFADPAEMVISKILLERKGFTVRVWDGVLDDAPDYRFALASLDTELSIDDFRDLVEAIIGTEVLVLSWGEPYPPLTTEEILEAIGSDGAIEEELINALQTNTWTLEPALR